MKDVLPAEGVGALLYWYSVSARRLPWREKITPYRTWISEIMLQQTRVEAVIPYFERFVHELPGVTSLAAVDPDRLNKLWQGLGYYSRARNLQKAAQVIVQNFGGELPGDYRQLLSLPGIGPYTAGAIASIAFGLPEPAVDGNVIRVYTRLAADGTRADLPALREKITAELRSVYPAGQCSAFTQALMELGAVICIPNGNPLCGECPLTPLCEAHRQGRECDFPQKPPKKARRVEERTVLLIRDGDTIVLRRRPERGLLSGLWEFPSMEGHLTEEKLKARLGEIGVTPAALTRGPDANHIFTHVEWHMISYLIRAQTVPPDCVRVTPEQLRDAYSVPSAFRAFCDAVGI